ncbi:MAG: hypothetical protein JWM21_1238 [Acidobacteria bacterium]|nr:hypothetical protein [Acidobacteriota bacterium]
MLSLNSLGDIIFLQGGAGSLPMLVFVVIVAAAIALLVRQARQNASTSEAFVVADPSISRQISALMKRYKDAYIVATITNGFGGIIKGIGAVIGGVLLLVGLLIVGNGRPGDATFAMGVVIVAAGVVSGVWFYIAGVLVSAQAQILKASIDGAVNSSPFLTNEHRATIMSLSEGVKAFSHFTNRRTIRCR